MRTKIVFFQSTRYYLQDDVSWALGNAGEPERRGRSHGATGWPYGPRAQKALISMAIINILGRDTDFSKIVAGALCLGMPMGADCTLATLRYSILRATNPQIPVNRVFCAPRRTVRGTQNRGGRLRAPGLGRAGPPPCPARGRGSVGAV